MSDDPCATYRQDLEAAIQEWQGLISSASNGHTSSPAQSAAPEPTGSRGTQPQLIAGRREAAQQRYRSAVRALSECLRQTA